METIIHRPDAPWVGVQSIEKIFEIYAKAGYDIRLIGGCVRDIFLKRPINDWDMASNALPEQSLNICQNAGLHVIPTNLKHGTITVILEHTLFEITTLRTDKKTDGRHAEVAWTTDWTADAQRRDFTINALYGDAKGYIYDYVGGIHDIKQNIIRFIGNANLRVSEDYLRILRYFRFLAQLGHFEQIDKSSLDACIYGQQGLHQISAERIWSELFKILTAKWRSQTILLMHQHAFFKLLQLPFDPVNLQKLDHTEGQLQYPPSALRSLACLLDKKADWRKIARQLKLSNKQKSHLSNIQKYLYEPTIFDRKALRKISYNTGYAACLDVYLIQFSPQSHQVIHWDDLIPESLPISGKDLLNIGIQAGKDIGNILKKLEQEYIESDFSLSKTQLLQLIK